MAVNETSLPKMQREPSAIPFDSNEQSTKEQNISKAERIASAAGGGALALYGLKRGGVSGMLLMAVGSSLAYRGVSGTCQVYKALGINRAEKDDRTVVHADAGVKIEKSVTINKSPEELYQFWRNFENLPKFMNNLESVEVSDNNRSHWVAKAPAGRKVEWDAEIINDRENEMIAWQSLEGADVANAGSVHFTPRPGGRGTEVRVSLRYEPPAGKIGVWIAKLFGEEPAQQVAEDLRRFKQLMETGVTATVEGQPSGRAKEASKASA